MLGESVWQILYVWREKISADIPGFYQTSMSVLKSYISQYFIHTTNSQIFYIQIRIKVQKMYYWVHFVFWVNMVLVWKAKIKILPIAGPNMVLF